MSEQDLRNHGHSPHATEHNYTVMAEDVEKFIDTHKIRRPVLIGHSMYVLCEPPYPFNHPDRLERVFVLTKRKGRQNRHDSRPA